MDHLLKEKKSIAKMLRFFPTNDPFVVINESYVGRNKNINKIVLIPFNS